MAALAPLMAAELASEVYQAQDEFSLETFLARKEFAKEQALHLKARVGTRLINTLDGFGLCARGGGTHKGESFIMFRGTTSANYGADFFTDARLGIGRTETGLPVHIGFNHAFNTSLPAIKIFMAGNTDSTIHCVGHSLGGAVATLAADWLVKNTGKNVQLYTFGSPRVGTDWFSKSVTTRVNPKNIYRVFRETDPVGMVPIYPFIHTTAQAYKPAAPSLPLTSGQAHFMANYVASVKSKNWLQLQDNSQHKYTLETSIKHWLESTTPVDASSSKFWQWVDSALIYILAKVLKVAAIALQGAFIGAITLADKIAYILAEGIQLGSSISIWVYHFMRKLMESLGLKIAENIDALTQSLMQSVLVRILSRMNQNAKNAVSRAIGE